MSRVVRLAFCFDPNRDFDRAVHVARVWTSESRWALGVEEELDHRGSFDTNARRQIKKSFANCDAALLLVGRDSIGSDWVNMELERVRKVPIVEVFVHALPDRFGGRDERGKSPLELHERRADASFDWEKDHGETNLVSWIGAVLDRPVPDNEPSHDR